MTNNTETQPETITVEVVTGMICQDCALYHTNDEPHPRTYPSGHWVVLGDAIEFHVPFTPCPSCGITMPGTWYPAESVA
jgi:hypothetical protein